MVKNREPGKKLSPDRVIVVVLALAIIGVLAYSLATRSGVFWFAKSLVMNLWDMLCDIANACSDFIKYVIQQRSN